MGKSALFSDIEAFLIGWLQARMDALGATYPYCQGWDVDNKEPDPNETFPDRLIVVRDDGMSRTSPVTAQQSVGISLLGGTKRTPFETKQAALMLLAQLEDLPSADPGNPVSKLISTTGPFAVPETQDRARQYIPVVLAVVGTPL